MGFSGIPPRPDQSAVLPTVDQWASRADAAILHISPPWSALLAGTAADAAVRALHLALVEHYRSRGLAVVVTLDATDGLNRAAEAPELVALGRSISEPAVQQAYRGYAVALATILAPDFLGLAAETDLIRLVAPPALYAALVAMVNDAAADVRAGAPAVPLYVSVQAEVAWGRQQPTPAYIGVTQDLADFPFVQALGISSYPYLGGFADPKEVPLDYYARLGEDGSLPLLVVEGGWPSVTVGAAESSPEEQARWIDRQVALLDAAGVDAVFQLTFADLDEPGGWPVGIAPFARLGLVDPAFNPKPALARWDAAFTRVRQ
ncbi:MAG: hypothetical protein ACREOC_00225 [Gemmatimonadales bacterium]